MKKLLFYSLLGTAAIMISCGKDDGGSITPISIGFDGNVATVSEDDGTLISTISFGAAAPAGGSFTVTLGGTASYGDDYTTEPAGTSGSFDVTVAAGDPSQSFSLTLIDDEITEAGETITFTISSSDPNLELGANTLLTVTLNSNDDVLVVIERSTGKLYSVDFANETEIEEMTIMYNSAALTGLKAMVYDATSGNAYLGSSNNDNAHIYSLDISTGLATLLNDNSDDVTDGPGRDGIADIKMDGDKIIAGTYHSGTQVIDWYNSDGSHNAEHLLTDPCCGGAISFGGLTGEVYYGSDDGELYKVNLTTDAETAISLNASNLTPFTDAYASFDITSTAVQNFAESSDGNTYAIIYQGGTGINKVSGITPERHWFLVTIDLATGAIEYVSHLESSQSTQKHGLAAIPDNVLWE